MGDRGVELNITPARTQLVVDGRPQAEFPTAAVMDAVARAREGDTTRQAKNNTMWGDLMKNPWFFVALALAAYAFTRRR